jgi:hypothetical protein
MTRDGDRVRLLQPMLGNSPGDVIVVTERTEGELYYYDGLDRWCYLPVSEEGKLWAELELPCGDG